MAKKIQDMTPVEIDEILAPIWEREYKAEADVLATTKRSAELQLKAQKLKNGVKVPGYTTPGDGIRLAETIQALNNRIMSLHEVLEQIAEEEDPYLAEYQHRGGWNRVFLATSSNGHAHNGTECSTCHHGEYRTGFSWLIQYSGKTEAEIIADAGERACTTCYPSAPVNAKGTKMFTPDEIEAQQRRAEREAEKARKEAEKDAKSITTPEGGKLYETTDNTSYMVCKTVRTAEIAATNALYDYLLDEHRWTLEEWSHYNSRMSREDRQIENLRHAWCLIRSIAHKKGLTFQEVFEVHEKKAQAKFRKTLRDWSK